MTNGHVCGCDPDGNARCDIAAQLLASLVRLHWTRAEANKAWSREQTPETRMRLQLAWTAVRQLWHAYTDHLGPSFEEQAGERSLLLSIDRERTIVHRPVRSDPEPPLADWRAQEKQRERALDAAGEVAYMRESGGWD